VTSEQLALPLLDRVDAAAGRLKNLVVVYPKPTLVARHPALLFAAPQESQEAARKWLAFLLSREIQQKAIEWGFRPASPEVRVHDYLVEQNRFLRLRRFGILTRPVLQEAPPPDGAQLHSLLELWGEATGRH
jgi:hypothetical protein